MFLEKKDVSLYYEVRGTGDPLILIHGVIVDAGLYENAADLLSSRYMVITYDRRGISRSRLKDTEESAAGESARQIIQKEAGSDAVDPDVFMDAQIQDILDLMDHLQIKGAYFAGASAGAVIGQYLMQRFPERVRHLIMYEPAMLGYMDKEPDVKEWTQDMLELIQKHKYNSAILAFAENIASFDERSPKKAVDVSFREMHNHEYCLNTEFPALVRYRPDLDAMRRMADRITLAAGEKSKGTFYYRSALELAESIGKKAMFYPGYHNLPYDLPREFAVSVMGTLMLSQRIPQL